MLHVGPHTSRQAGNVRITQHPGVILQPSLQWKSSKHYTRTAKTEASKQASITYSEYAFVVFGIQREIFICHTVIRDLSGSTIIIFTLSHKRHDFRKTILKIKCVFWFSLQLLSETFLILM
jgi:hypothetical protein